MSTSVSLRKTLRRLPEFASLPGDVLNAIITKMVYREYEPGEVLWRTGHELGFLGIIQSGEIVVEYRLRGRVMRSVKLRAGESIKPEKPRAKVHGESVLARATTQVRLYALRKEQIAEFQLIWLDSQYTSPSQSSHLIPVASWALTIITAITIILLGWRDLNRILSGSLFLVSEQVLQSTSDYQSTMKLLKYAEVLDNGAAFPHTKEGFIWFSQNNIAQAETAFMNAVHVDLGNGSALNNLAVTYFTKRAFQQALPYQKRAVQADPDNAITHYNLGLLLIEENNLPEAIREFKEASYIDPSWALPYKQRAYVYLQMQDYPTAEEEASIAVRLEIEDQTSHLVNAIAQHTQGKDQEALEAIDNALKLAPDDEVSRFYKAMILTRLGNYDEALSILQQLLDETNDSRQVSRIIAEINSVQRTLQRSTDTETQ